MGLIKAVAGALGGTLADQWKEYFYCESLPTDVLIAKGQKVVSRRSSNTKGNDNIITSGSGIVVADGQFMIIVEDGAIVEFCGEPGRFTYDASTEPSLFTGSFWAGIKNTFKTAKRRLEYGGDAARDQRVYYFNMKEILNNKFGTPSPIYFKIVDRNINLDLDAQIRCNGVYSYKITDPILFYRSVAANVSSRYTRDQIDPTLKSEFVDALQPAVARLTTAGVSRPNELPAHTAELRDALNAELTEKWINLRGITIVSVALNPISLTEEDAAIIREAQKIAMLKDPSMRASKLADSYANAMENAASNQAGALTGFVGMNAAAQSGANLDNVFAAGDAYAKQKAEEAKAKEEPKPFEPAMPAPEKPANTWTCACGAVNTGKFCSECGNPKPQDTTWTCECGTVNKGKFCTECGKPKPAKKIQYRCSNCGWEPEDPENPPKFCPNCGDPFNDQDAI